jgi:predicted house-cleaning noncanonical NTP pyrophosphatase (MazG superfamily)
MPKFLINKLVRDKLPFSEMVPYNRVVTENAEFIALLKTKLQEEALEVQKVSSVEELLDEIGDVYEVLDNLLQAENVSWGQVHAMRLLKKQQRGGFEGRIFGIAVDIPEAHPSLEKYRGQPEKYLEVQEK